MAQKRRIIAISGDLGSGKSALSRVLSEQIGCQRIGIGDLQRQIAHELEMSTLELNRLAETDDSIDRRVDERLRELENHPGPLVIDSRLAWWFVPGTLKVHLVVRPETAARRIVDGSGRKREDYASAHQAISAIRQRAGSERARFKSQYGVDIHRLRNYDMVIDTTDVSVERVASEVGRALNAVSAPQPASQLLLHPQNIFPSDSVRALLPGKVEKAGAAVEGVLVGYSSPFFFMIDGHNRLSAAIRGHHALISAQLVAEESESVIAGISANTFFSTECSLSKTYDWESVHSISLPEHPASSRNSFQPQGEDLR